MTKSQLEQELEEIECLYVIQKHHEKLSKICNEVRDLIIREDSEGINLKEERIQLIDKKDKLTEELKEAYNDWYWRKKRNRQRSIGELSDN